MKKITLLILLLTSLSGISQCLSSVNGQWPTATFVPDSSQCDGITLQSVTTCGYASEYSVITVVSGQTYTFSSSNTNDVITISTDAGATAASYGIGSVTWLSTVSGDIRFYTHLDATCAAQSTCRTKRVACGVPPCIQPTVTFGKTTNCPADTSFNATANIINLGTATSITITDNQGSAPQTVSTTGLVTFGPYANGTTVILTATNDQTPICSVVGSAQTQTACPPTNDNFVDAIAITCGNTYSEDTSLATLDEANATLFFGVDLDAPNVWYSYTGSGTPEAVTLNLCGSSYDTSVLVLTGTSGNLTAIAGNDDDNTCVSNTLNSNITFTSDGTTTYYIVVEGYNSISTGLYTMDVSCSAVNLPAVDNQDCGTALNVPVDGTDNISDNSFGTISSTQPTCDLFGSIQDVWFSFVAPTSGNVTLTLTPGTMTSMNYLVYSGTCGALTAIGNCNSNWTAVSTQSYTALTPNSIYYVQVWSNAVEQGTFTLRLSDDGLGNNSFNSSNFLYYPNPVKNTLTLSNNPEISGVEVFNLLGQKVVSAKFNSNLAQVDMSNLSEGAYMVKVTSNGQVKTIKVIKQ